MLKPIRVLLLAAALGCTSLAAAVTALPTTASAQSVPSARQIALYRDLMEANGTAQNVRRVMANARTVIDQTAAERKGSALTPAEQRRLDTISTSVLDVETEQTLSAIAAAQAGDLTEAEISQLIAINRTPAALRFNAFKLEVRDGDTALIQSYMVDAVVAIIQVFQDDQTPPTPAAVNPPDADAALVQRIGLARSLLEVEGTAEITSGFIGRIHMKMNLDEVARYIDLTGLSASDSRRLASIAAVEQQALTDRVLQLSAVNMARALSRADIAGLIAAFDIEAQRKLTALRLADDGSIDQQAELAIQSAADEIVLTFEAGQ